MPAPYTPPGGVSQPDPPQVRPLNHDYAMALRVVVGVAGVPLPRWNCPEFARELAVRCEVAVSASSARRPLAAAALKPWQHRSWISIRDPEFEAKADQVLDLSAGRRKGRRLGPND